MSVAAYLGGHLVYEDRIGVDHTAGLVPPSDFTPVLADDDLLENQPHRVDAGGMPVVLVRQDGHVYALADTCAHLGGSLSEGALQDGNFICPWHGSRFVLENGRVLDGPSAFPQPTLETRMQDGRIEVRAGRIGASD
jgi:nitrite reductase/ring-hydroxylating ferredoxin subunit